MSSVSKDPKTLSEKQRKLLKLLLGRGGIGLKQTARMRRQKPNAQLPLSFAQQRLWFLDRLVPDSPFYNLPSAFRLRAPLVQAPINEQAVRAALNEIVRRHEVLRTSFGEEGGKPFLVVSPSLEVPFEVRDLRHLDPATRDRESLRLATEDAQLPFDLRRGPFLRASLLRLGELDYVFLMSMHHIVADAWSTGVFVEEYKQLYTAFSQGLPSPLPELEIQYADFAIWQRNRLAAGELHPQLRYWTKKLANLPQLELPTDFPHRDIQGFEGETQYVPLPAQLSQDVQAFSLRNDVTLFATLFAVFNALLYRYTGQDEIVIGEPVANRTRAELEPLIGFFVNSLVLRTDVSGDPTFRELLRRSWQEALAALDNQDIPFEVIVERLKPERSMGRNPLFQVSLQFYSGADAQSHTGVVPSEIINVEKGTASLDLAFDFFKSRQGILLRVEYSTELFRRETIRRIISHYQNLLTAFIENPELRLSEAPMLSTEELPQVL
ncbi:MAG TPA: condensation domain-containing protein, partial [Pyrinomonadaceae bacterium]